MEEDSREDRTTARLIQGSNADEAHVIHVRDSHGAKYKLMSPAMLPIPRHRNPSDSITPSLSPTSFLDSPVLLHNTKAEPSPTTGSFSKVPLMPKPGAGNGSKISSFDDKNSSGFEFKWKSGSSSASGVLTAPMVITGSDQMQNNSVEQVQDHQSQSSEMSSSVKCETVNTSQELTLSAPMNMLTSGVCMPSSVASEKVNLQRHVVTGHPTSQSDHKGLAQRCDDNNWQKYGQILVKECQFPRSYYKCMYPNCGVNKTFEYSYDGQKTEIVYRDLSLNGQKDKSIISSQTCSAEPNGNPFPSPRQMNDDEVDALQSNNNDKIDEDDPVTKRRKLEACSSDYTPVLKPIREPRVVVQTVSEVDILDDGYRWRKYGQKVVRGNPNPRSYYKCTNAGCPVRKHVERACHDFKAVVTTYEGKHNHDVPAPRTTTNHEIPGPTAVSRVRPEGTNTISLDLGVGINPCLENRNRGALGAEPVHNKMPVYSSSLHMPQASSVLPCFSVINGSMNLLVSRDNSVEGLNFATLPLNHSNQYPQKLGKIFLGP